MGKENGKLSPTVFSIIANECEKKGLALWNREWEFTTSESMLLGSFVDALSQGEKDSFIEKHPEVLTIRDKKLKEKFQKAFDDFNHIMNTDSVFASFLTGNMQKEVEGEIDGVPFHGFTDFITDTRIVDLKYISNANKLIFGENFVRARYYDWQLAIYRELAKQMDGKERECYIAYISKEKPCDHHIIHIPSYALVEAEAEIKKALPRVKALIDGKAKPVDCGVCEYCRETKVVTEPIEMDKIGLVKNYWEE